MGLALAARQHCPIRLVHQDSRQDAIVDLSFIPSRNRSEPRFVFDKRAFAVADDFTKRRAWRITHLASGQSVGVELVWTERSGLRWKFDDAERRFQILRPNQTFREPLLQEIAA